MAGSSASGRKRKMMIKKAEKKDADDLKTPGSRSKKWQMPTDAGAAERRIFCTSCRRTPELATLTNECNCETFVKSTISDGLFHEFLNWIS
jgi:hypothetical protein